MGKLGLYVLFEHSAGMALFFVKEMEDIAAQLANVAETLNDVTKFKSICSFSAFHPFTSALNALDVCNSISEGVLHEDMQTFLENGLPSKKRKYVLGVGDKKLAASIVETLGCNCESLGIVPEVIRGIRLHFCKLVPNVNEAMSRSAQLGLSHSYSRSKVKFNIHRSDNSVIQSINLVDQLDKDMNTFAMRMKEWYSYYFPELVKIVPDSHTYSKVVEIIGDRNNIDEEKQKKLEDLLMDSDKVAAICQAAKSSFGFDVSPVDLKHVLSFSSEVAGMGDFRKEIQSFLGNKMADVAPNLQALAGDSVGARLISHAGSLTNLAKYPASTVQILGAEKALFRALKMRGKGKTPKYGLIFHSTFIGRAAAKNKGRISRYLANKASMACRIDCFAEIPTSVFGEHMKTQVEERIKFYDTGEKPRKTADVMADAITAAKEARRIVIKKGLKKKRKAEKKAAKSADRDLSQASVNETVEVQEKLKERKKSEAVAKELTEKETPEKTLKKKKRKRLENDDTPPNRKKVKLMATEENTDSSMTDVVKKKKKKLESGVQTTSAEKKKKKKKKNHVDPDV